jgi:hypothetical protein
LSLTFKPRTALSSRPAKPGPIPPPVWFAFTAGDRPRALRGPSPLLSSLLLSMTNTDSLSIDDLAALIELVSTNNQYNDGDDLLYWEGLLARLTYSYRHYNDDL